ncbi:MAG: signal peptidase I [Lactobacillales bacterium]|jgi:signal peptidase I|nr:signal peptidase I [Lactobacillales bacterium]
MSKKDLIQGGIILFVLMTIWALLRSFVFKPISIQDSSMSPALIPNEHVLAFRSSDIKRFDLIAFSLPNKPEQVERIIGFPGDEIHSMEDVLYINGKAIQEPYLDSYKKKLTIGELFTADFNLESLFNKKVVPKGKYFVLEDNRKENSDSRKFGFVDKKSMIGKVKFVYWPLKSFGRIDNSITENADAEK